MVSWIGTHQLVQLIGQFPCNIRIHTCCFYFWHNTNIFDEKIPACFSPLNFPAKKPNRLRPCTRSGFALLRRHDTFNHHFDMKMQRARTNNIARESAITEKTVTSFRSIKVILIDSRNFSKTRRGKRERSETQR